MRAVKEHECCEHNHSHADADHSDNERELLTPSS